MDSLIHLPWSIEDQDSQKGEQKSQDLNNKPVLFLYIVVGISFPTILSYMISFPNLDRTSAKVNPHAKKLVKKISSSILEEIIINQKKI